MTLEEERKWMKKSIEDREAFAPLYDYYFPIIFNYVYRRILNFEVANDIASEVFLKAYLNRWKFRWKQISVGAWFYRIACNEVNQFFRSKKYRPQSLNQLQQQSGFDAPDFQEVTSDKQKAEAIVKQHEDFLIIQRQVAKLPVHYQEVIALRYFENKTIKEIADILGKKEGTVKSLLSRGVGKLKDKITLDQSHKRK